jgi:hypothetical protein
MNLIEAKNSGLYFRRSFWDEWASDIVEFGNDRTAIQLMFRFYKYTHKEVGPIYHYARATLEDILANDYVTLHKIFDPISKEIKGCYHQ